jgi:hypothetical protein
MDEAAGTRNDGGNNFPLNSAHTGGINVLKGDATVSFASNSMALTVIYAYCTRAGNEQNLDSN